MKRKSREVRILAQLLFPETYQDAVDSLLKHMPFLKVPEMKGSLIKRASFLTFLSVGSSSEVDWDIKEEAGVDVTMYIFLPNESLSGEEKIADEENRKGANYSFVNKMVTDYARSFGQPIKRLPHYK